ncbi:MAG: hypothetical protein ACRCX2_24875 [Paraclostridium sp.]
MPTTSGRYTFQVIEVEVIIREAFERIGILGEFVEAQKLLAARNSINFLLLEWMNKSVNLWTLQSTYLALTPNQGQYTLTDTISDVIQANLRTFTRQLNGTATASNGGIALNAFDGDPQTVCDAGNNGNISYDYGAGVTQQINFIGVQSSVTRNYTLLLEISVDNLNWNVLHTIPAQTFIDGVTVWIDVPIPVNARAYRIRETGGIQLSLRELYFNNNVLDMPISNVSRYEYYTYPNKNLQGRPSVFYFDRQITPVLNIWPVPTNQYNCMQYTFTKMMQDVGAFTNSLQIPSLFYPAMVWGVAYYMALKYAPQTASIMQSEYEKAFNLAAAEDAETTPLRISPDYSKGYYS